MPKWQALPLLSQQETRQQLCSLWTQKQPHLALVLPLIFQRTWQESHLPSQVTGPPTMVLVMDPETVSKPMLACPSRINWETHPFLLLEVDTGSLVQVWILKQYCKLASFPPSYDPITVLPTQRPRRRNTCQCPQKQVHQPESECIF